MNIRISWRLNQIDYPTCLDYFVLGRPAVVLEALPQLTLLQLSGVLSGRQTSPMLRPVAAQP